MFHVVFLVIYSLAASFFTGAQLFILLTIHFGIGAINHLREKQILVTPLFLFYIGTIVVNIANLSLISQVEARDVRTYSYIIPQYIDQAALIWCISCTLVAIGYQLTIKKSLPPVNFDFNKRSVLQYLFWILLLANALSIIGYGSNFRGNQIAKIFGLVNTIGILFFARLWAKNENKTYRTYALALFAIETYTALLSSYLRFELILPTFYLAVGYFIGKGNLRTVFSYRIIPFLIIILIYSSVFTALQQNRSNFISVFQESDNMEERESDTGPSRGGLLDRSANLAQVTNVVNLVERNGFYEGAASAPILTALIPRVIWPDKPLIQLGAWFALEIGAGSRTSVGLANNSINMTVPGELYLDFGWIGVILGSLFFGSFLALLWNSTRFYASEYNLTGTIYGGYLFIISIGGYADLQVVVTLLSTYLIFLIIKKIADHYANSGYRTVVARK
ncbi:MAG: hypothetical protein K0Q79_1781 [Flavipsychrobacter sp.]|jgi:hypothetical protein|nr:hypothetical protein [Flavipsychrobacter sp.]